jgi:hypothetical protein
MFPVRLLFVIGYAAIGALMRIDEDDALNTLRAMKLAKKKQQLRALRDDADVGFLVERLSRGAQNRPRAKHAALLAGCLGVRQSQVASTWRRRGVVTAQSVLAAILEGFGRTAPLATPRELPSLAMRARACLVLRRGCD